jgi:hypothetical protein
VVLLVVLCIWRMRKSGILTTVRVPTISRGGSMLLSTSWLTKWAVMPTMDIMATMLRPREMRKVFASGAEVAILMSLSLSGLEVVVVM